MQKALETLPWVRKATVDFKKKQATLVVERGKYKAKEALVALKKAGFGGKEVEKQPAADVAGFPSVSFRVGRMLKTKSGAT